MRKKLLTVIQLVRRGGVEMMAINFARHLDKEKFEIAFLLVNPYENSDTAFQSALEAEGFTFYAMPENSGDYLKKYAYLRRFFAEHDFDMVYSHVLLFSGIVCTAARQNGVGMCAVHSHITEWNKKENIRYKIYKMLMQRLIAGNATYLLACSVAAGEYLYGKAWTQRAGKVIPNAVEAQKFAYDAQARQQIRETYSIGEDILIGHVGSVYKIKNQTFLVEIFAQLLKKLPDSRLILVGEIFEKEPVDAIANALGVADKIIFTGAQASVAPFYSAMDLMIFPSLHEGFPVSLVEAQFSRLPCLISDSIHSEVMVNDNVAAMPLNAGAEAWASKAQEMLQSPRMKTDITPLTAVYDISAVADELETLFLNER